MTLFLRRLVEHFVVGVILSVICTYFLVNVADTTTKSIVFVVMLLCITIHIIHFCSCLAAQWRYTLNPAEYFAINILVCLIYAAVNIIMAAKNVEPVYAYMFLSYKIFMIFDMGKVISAVLVNVIMLLFVFIVPIAIEPRGKERFRGY